MSSTVVVAPVQASSLKKVDQVIEVKENGHAPSVADDSSNTIFTSPAVYMIYSSMSLHEITEAIKPFGEIYFMRIIYKRIADRVVNTNLTAAVLKPETYRKLCDAGYRQYEKNEERPANLKRREHNFRISVCKFNLRNLPDLTHVYNDIHISVPPDLECEGPVMTKALTKILDQMERGGVMPPNSYLLRANYSSREGTGTVRNYNLSFQPEVSDQTRTIVTFLLNESRWPISFPEADEMVSYTIFAAFRRKVNIPRNARSLRDSEPDTTSDFAIVKRSGKPADSKPKPKSKPTEPKPTETKPKPVTPSHASVTVEAKSKPAEASRPSAWSAQPAAT